LGSDLAVAFPLWFLDEISEELGVVLGVARLFNDGNGVEII